MSTEKLYVSWKTLEEDTTTLANKLKDAGLGSDVELVCVSRGGLFIGGLLGYINGYKNVHCVSLESYVREENNGNEEVICRTPFLPVVDKDKTYLIVDDINDTSKTYQFIKDECESLGINYVFATTYHKTRSNNLTPDFIGPELDPECWVVFPWDQM